MRFSFSFLILTLFLVPTSFGVEYPFTSVDILGRDVTPGSSAYDPVLNVYTVTADGYDIWDRQDDFRFLYVEISGDFSVSVRVDDPAGRWPHSWSKAGIMVRQDVSPGSKDVYLVATRDNGVAFQWRDAPNSPASWTGVSEPPNPVFYPIWLRIVRDGNEFTGWYSEDGKSWVKPTQNTHTLSMSDPVLVGICLTSHLSGVLATATFGDFHIPELEASTVAIPPPDQTRYEGDTVLLDGSKSWNGTAFRWEQVILDDEPRVAIANADQAIARFIAPQLDVGAVLTFQLRVYSSKGKDSAFTHVSVRAKNAPIVPPEDLQAEPGNLSVTLRWEALLDADSYVVKRAEQPPNGGKSAFQTIRPHIEGTAVADEYLEEGTTYYYVVAARNSFPPYEGLPSSEISFTAMPNLALRPDATPIALVTAPTGGGLKNLNAIMNGNTRENYDTYDNYRTLDEDWFGYSWPDALYFDHIVFYEGQHFDDGGWWTSLAVQFSDDGLAWKEAPDVEITPSYEFTDSRLGRSPFSRFDITFKPVRARSIRIYGTPGGIAGFTSIAELEVYGNQNRDALMVYGLDKSFDEGHTAILDGRYSFSTRGPMLLYRWAQTSGPPVTVPNVNSPVTSFTAPGVEQDTLLTFALTASDGFDEKTDEVRILIRNIITRADAGYDLAVQEGASTQLDATASKSTSGMIAPEWRQLSGPVAILSNTNSLRPLLTAPHIVSFSEKLVFQLVVDDGLGRPDSISADTVTVLVKNRLNNMPHLEKSGLIVIEAENYTSINRRNDDRGTWRIVEGQPTYVEVSDMPSVGGTRTWQDAAEISFDIKILHTGNYFIKLRRFVPHGAGHEGGTNNSCFVGINGAQVGVEFDNAANYNSWVWAPGRLSEPLTFDALGTYSLSIRCREDGYRIDRIVLYQPGAAGVPDDWSSDIGPVESAAEARIVCSRELGTHYTPGTSHLVSLHLDVNVSTVPESLVLVEYFARNFSVLDSGDGDGSIPGTLFWNLTFEEVTSRTFTYVLAIPGATSGPAQFSGNFFYGDVTNQQTQGQTHLYPVPPPPQSVGVEMLVGATVSWLPVTGGGVVAYHVYRSSDGKNWLDVSGPRRQSPFVDSTIQPGETYIYKVCAESPTGVQTSLSSSLATFPQTAPAMEIREAEDYDYGGGRFPGGPNAPAAAEASSANELDAGLDYFYQNQTQTNSYRSQDRVDIRPGEGASRWFMGYSTTGDWWRYTFDVPVAGYVKLAYRGSTSGTSPATIEFLWDENPVGTITYNTPGGWRDWTYYSLQPFFSGEGEHVLRMRLAAGNADYDLIALGYAWELDGRKVIFAEDFSGYSETSEVTSFGGWTTVSESSSRGAWQLWNTAGDPLTTKPDEPGPDLPGMTENYMVSNGDFGPEVPLDEQLISPEIDCTGYEAVSVEFSNHINIYENDPDGDLQTSDFDLSLYDLDSQSWSDWGTIFTHDHSSGDYGSSVPVSFDVSSLADGKKIRFRWRFHNTRNDFWWAIDNIIVSGRRVEQRKIVAVLISGANTLTFSWDRFGMGYYAVQYTDNLDNSAWTDVEGTDWPIISTTWSGTLPAGNRQRFYRVISR